MMLRRKVTVLFQWCGRTWRSKLASSPRRFLSDCTGSTAIVLAVVMPVLILGMGLGAETGYQYMTQRKLQHAADLAAHAGAIRLRVGDAQPEIMAAAAHVAAGGGYSAATGTIEVNTPPLAGPATGDGRSVEVILTQSEPRYFSLLISNQPVVIGARAVARVMAAESVACVLALSPTESGAVTVSGSTTVGLNGCDIASNSNASDSFLMSGGGAQLSAHCVHAVGQAVVTNQLQLSGCPAVREFAPVVRDPYESVAEPALMGACRDGNIGNPNSQTTLSPSDNHPSGVNSIRFCNGLHIRGAVSFEPGLYIIEGGDFSVHGASGGSSAAAAMGGEGVTFFLTGSARIVINGNADLALAAPSSGPYSGLLFFASRSQVGISHRLAGTSGSTMQGAVYAPASALVMTGNSRSTGGCTQIIGRRVTFTGNSTLLADCTDAGTTDIEASRAIAIIE